MTFRKTLLLLLMITFGFAIWTTLLSYHPQLLASMQHISLPDGYMEDVRAVIMDKQGKPKLKISSPRMVHYIDNDTTNLASPHVTIYRNSPLPWLVTAKNGKASQGIDKVDFWNNVVIHHPADESHPTTVIKTEQLTVHTNEQTAETKALITLIQPNLTMTAIGMFADMNNGNITLLSQARGDYVPN